MKKGIIAFILLMCIIFVFSFSTIVNMNAKIDANALERIHYEGTITTYKHDSIGGHHKTYIWLNNERGFVEIRGYFNFAVGEEYVITVDGNGKLINAVIK